MNAPIIYTKDLTPNPEYKDLEQLINAMPEGEYRKQYNTYKARLIKAARAQLFTKAQAERIANNIMYSYIVRPYIEVKTEGGYYDLDDLSTNLGFYEIASRAFLLRYWNKEGNHE